LNLIASSNLFGVVAIAIFISREQSSWRKRVISIVTDYGITNSASYK